MIDAIEEIPSTALAQVAKPRPSTLMRPIAQPKDILVAQEETRALIQETLKQGRDYGTIPGINKPSLLKPGAERVGMAFGCYPRYRIIEQEIDHNRKVEWRKKTRGRETTGESLGLYRYVVECEIVHRDTGQVVGDCIGVCSTMESKYVDRPRDCENTALKIAQKRAHVGATLNAFGLSEQFTQDVEDNPETASTDEEAAYDGPLTRDSEVNWGKHAEKPVKVRDLPLGYVKWAAEDGRKFGPRTEEWQKLFRAELDLREIDKDQKRADAGETRQAEPEPAMVGGDPEDELPF